MGAVVYNYGAILELLVHGYKFLTISAGEWLLFAAEIAVAAVIYFELEHSRRTSFLEKATGKISDQERRDIYAVYLNLLAKHDSLEDRANAFMREMYNDHCLKTKCDNEIALFNEMGFMTSPWLSRKKP
jgi:hypothetical protein